MKYLIFLLLAATACSNPVSSPAGQKDLSEPFARYRQKFPVTPLPLHFTHNNELFDKVSSLKKFDVHGEDTLFLETDGKSDVYLYGMLEDTSDFYTLLYLYPAEHFAPQIVTYNKKGHRIAEEHLLARGCRGDCGISRCVESATINEDMTIVASDSSRYEFFCDSITGEPLPGEGKVVVRVKQGKIKSNGKIKLNKETTRELKKGPEPRREPEPEGEW